jgi:hypothetical protein
VPDRGQPGRQSSARAAPSAPSHDRFSAESGGTRCHRGPARPWRLGLARKLQIFRDTYAMLNDEAQTARGNVLEVIIILLIVTEVILGLVRH